MILIKLRYNETEPNDRVEYQINKLLGTASVKYYSDGMLLDQNSIDIVPIVELNTAADIKVELAKKGLVWDLHIKNHDPVTKKEHRKTLSLVLDRDLTVIKSVFENPSTQDYTLRDLLTYELMAYDSSLNLGKFDFTTSDGITGQTSLTELTPVIEDAGLVLRDGALIDIDLTNAPVDLTETRYVAWDFREMPAILSMNPCMMYFYLGKNEFVLGPNGLAVTEVGSGAGGSLIIPSGVFAPSTSIVFVFDKDGNDAVIYRGVRYNTKFSKAEPINDIRYSITTHGSVKYVLDNLILQSSTNYFVDSEPPARVQDVQYIGSDESVYVAWEANVEEDMDGYNVYVDGIKNNLALITTTNFQVTGLTNGFPHRIVVTAVDKSGNESVPTEPFVITTSSSPEKEISGLYKFHNDNGVTLTFYTPTYLNFDKIRIYREDLQNLGLHLIGEIPSDSDFFVDEPRPATGKYRYVVRTVDTFGNETTGVSAVHNII